MTTIAMTTLQAMQNWSYDEEAEMRRINPEEIITRQAIANEQNLIIIAHYGTYEDPDYEEYENDNRNSTITMLLEDEIRWAREFDYVTAIYRPKAKAIWIC